MIRRQSPVGDPGARFSTTVTTVDDLSLTLQQLLELDESLEADLGTNACADVLALSRSRLSPVNIRVTQAGKVELYSVNT